MREEVVLPKPVGLGCPRRFGDGLVRLLGREVGMGWSGGDEIVEPVIKYLYISVSEGRMVPEDATGILEILIRACQARDWDTEDETLGLFRNLRWVVEAFRRCGVYLVCGAEQRDNHRCSCAQHGDHAGCDIMCRRYEGCYGAWHPICELPHGHAVDHRDDDYDYEWPVATERS